MYRVRLVFLLEEYYLGNEEIQEQIKSGVTNGRQNRCAWFRDMERSRFSFRVVFIVIVGIEVFGLDLFIFSSLAFKRPFC